MEMFEPRAPRWIDDLFPFATPRALADLLSEAWRAATEEGYYDWIVMATHLHDVCRFDLTVVPGPPAGWTCSPEYDRHTLEPGWPLFAPPEFHAFGSLGDGSYVGWVVAAPELGLVDYPVGRTGHAPGVELVGEDTRSALDFLVAGGLGSERERSSDVASVLRHAAPADWWYAPGDDDIGVLAAADAFAPDQPAVLADDLLEPVLSEVTRHLDAGFPATALLGIRNAFFHTWQYSLPALKPLWIRAYRDLGRPELVPNLDRMSATYDALR
jgi:hypothetical protein